jgi:hypothetical protein
VPEPVRIAFHSFSDIKNLGTYAAPEESLLLQTWSMTRISEGPNFHLPKWWEIPEGEKMSKPFNVGEQLVIELLCVRSMVSALFYI